MTDNLLPLLPLLICLGSIMSGCLFWNKFRYQLVSHCIGLVALTLSVGCLIYRVWQQGILTTAIGNWPAPFGITLVADKLSAIMLSLTAVTTLCTGLYSLVEVRIRLRHAGYYPAFWVLVLGICGSFLTGDLFNLYVWFEVMLIGSFILMAIGKETAQIDGTIKYVSLNLIATTFMLAAIAMLYGVTGTLNLADLAVKLAHSPQQGLILTIAILLTLSFATKAGLFPLFFWLPASYHNAPVAASALFAGMLTKVGIYALIRIYTLLFLNHTAYTHTLLLVIANLTMITGVLGAASQFGFRRILSFHIISQVGYMVMGLAIFSPLALAGTIFYIIHHIIVKANLFLISGLIKRYTGSFDLHQLGGVYKRLPWLAILFLIPAFSLAGFPPLSGFWAKFLLIKASIVGGYYFTTIIALAVGLLTLYSMTKIWEYVFWKPAEGIQWQVVPTRELVFWVVPIVILIGCTVTIGLYPQLFLQIAQDTVYQLENPSIYISAVLIT